MQQTSRDSTTKPGENQNGNSSRGTSKAKAQEQLFTFDGGDTHHPPWFVGGLAWTGIIVGIGANLWQVYTSDIAFQTMGRNTHQFSTLSPSGRAGAEPVIQFVCFFIAVVFQLGLMYFVFRIKQEFKNTRANQGVKGMEAIRFTAVSIIDHQKILLLWTIIAFVADTLGDFTFIGLYFDDPFLIFMYTAALYAAATVLLSKALETQWAAAIAYANWKSFRMYQKIQEMKLAKRMGS